MVSLRRSANSAKSADTDAARGARQAAEGEGRMTLMEHLGELRKRILISISGILVGAVVGFVLYEPILRLLSDPYRDATKGVSRCPKGCELITVSVLSPFAVRLKIATYVGILIASPIVLWQIWRFVTPALTNKERKYAIPFVLSTILLFSLGAFVAWLTLPQALGFLVDIGGKDLNVQSTADSYINLVGLMFVAFGLSFEFPVILVALLLVRVLKTTTLRKFRRHAIVGIIAFAAVITPSQDPYSLFLMAIPMWLFFELSIVIGRILSR